MEKPQRKGRVVVNKDSYVSVEDWLASQKYNRPRFSQSYDYNKLLRDRIANVLMERFDWDYWVTITFGFCLLIVYSSGILYRILANNCTKEQVNKI